MTMPSTSDDARAGLGRSGEHLSIVVPTYNCAEYLGDTLRSLQSNAPRIARAQIEVVDDCSTQDDPAAVVQGTWPEQVTFHQHPRNLGPTRNFNACLARAERDWIHVLHGDDFVMPGAYEEFAACLQVVPDAQAIFARTVFVDAKGIWTGLTEQLGPDPRGILQYTPTMWSACPVQFASVLISRRAIEQVGGFDETFTHAADYNLWWRLARNVRVAYTNSCVAAYRNFPSNHSASLRRSARNLDEHLKQVERVLTDLRERGELTPTLERTLYRRLMYRTMRQIRDYVEDPEGFRAHEEVLARLPLAPRSRLRRMELQLRHMVLTARLGGKTAA